MELQIGLPLVIESLRMQLVHPTELRLDGTLNSDSAQSQVNRHLKQLHTRVVRDKHSSFTVDVRTLGFVNSSAIRVFVDWISRAEEARYKLIFMTDRSITWHRLSFSALKSLAPSFVEINDRDGEAKSGGRAT
jgi:hypothetical protein